MGVSINSTFVIDRFHLMNTCHTDPRKFSCAVDCFIELSKLDIFVSYLSPNLEYCKFIIKTVDNAIRAFPGYELTWQYTLSTTIFI